MPLHTPPAVSSYLLRWWPPDRNGRRIELVDFRSGRVSRFRSLGAMARFLARNRPVGLR